MKRLVKKTTVFCCDICHQEYASARPARACERRGVETKLFKKGDSVLVQGSCRICPNGHEYVCRGTVKRVLGPLPYDAEIFLKGFGLKDTGLHRYLYEIPCKCPTCGTAGGGLYPARLLERPSERENHR